MEKLKKIMKENKMIMNETYQKCHMCEEETEFYCRDCGEPVCEDCAVPYTLQNQIDYTKCQSCQDGGAAARSLEYNRQQEEIEKKKAIQAKRIATRKANYYKPENIAKRKAAKIERDRQKIELRRKQMQEAFRIVNEMFRGM